VLVALVTASGCERAGCHSGAPAPAGDTGAPSAAAASPAAALEEALDRLAAQLADPAGRDGAVEALVALGAPALPALRQSLAHPDPEVRIAAVEVLARLGRPAVVDLLLVALQDQDEEVRLESVEALGALADRRAVAPLRARYPAEDDSAVRYEILTTLGRIGDPGTVEFLVAETGDADRYVRMWAMDALCVMRAPPASERVVALVRDPDLYVRRQVLTSCGTALDSAAGREELIRIALTAEDFEEAVLARRNLQRVLQGAWMIEELRQQIRTVGRPALAGEQPLLAALLLADVNDAAGVPQLLAGLDSPNHFVRHHAAYEVGRLGGPEVVPGLVKALADPQPLVAATAYDALLGFAERGNAQARDATAAYTGTKFGQRLPRQPSFD